MIRVASVKTGGKKLTVLNKHDKATYPAHRRRHIEELRRETLWRREHAALLERRMRAWWGHTRRAWKVAGRALAEGAHLTGLEVGRRPRR